jgi:hypothetical protein
MSTLTVSFTPSSPTPSNGYRVKYWLTSAPGTIYTVTPNPTTSPVTITGLSGTNYSGTIEAACSGGQYSTPVSFSASITPTVLDVIATNNINSESAINEILIGASSIHTTPVVSGGGGIQMFTTSLVSGSQTVSCAVIDALANRTYRLTVTSSSSGLGTIDTKSGDFTTSVGQTTFTVVSPSLNFSSATILNIQLDLLP